MRAKRIPIEEQYRLVMECRQSGLSDHNWCIENDIKPGTFYNWVKRLRQTGTYAIPDPASRDTYKSPKQEVVKIELVEEPVLTPKPAHAASISKPLASFEHSLELHIGNASVLIANDVDPLILSQTLQFLQGSLSC